MAPAAVATALVLASAGDGALASVISRAEIEGGMRSAERAAVARLFEALTLLPGHRRHRLAGR